MIKKLSNFINNYILSPKNYARKVGVLFGNNCVFPKSINFGSEPYLITIGDNFYPSINVKFITHDGSVNILRNLYPEYKNVDLIDKIEIGNNVFLGADVIVLPGSIIEDNIIVGAKSLVKGCLKKNSVYAGSPIRYICSIDEYLEKKKNDFISTKSLNMDEKKDFLLKHFDQKEASQ